MSTDAPSPPKQDLVFVHGPSAQGDGLCVTRRRDETIEVGEIHAIKEGQPIHGEVVKLTARKEHERVFDVEVLVPREEIASLSHAGPAQVATDRYRENWEAIFGGGRSESSLPN